MHRFSDRTFYKNILRCAYRKFPRVRKARSSVSVSISIYSGCQADFYRVVCVFSLQHTYGVPEPSCSASVAVIRCALVEDETSEWLNLPTDTPPEEISVLDFDFFDSDSLVVVYTSKNVEGLSVGECSGSIEADHELDRPG